MFWQVVEVLRRLTGLSFWRCDCVRVSRCPRKDERKSSCGVTVWQIEPSDKVVAELGRAQDNGGGSTFPAVCNLVVYLLC